jgi:hypothetical protein
MGRDNRWKEESVGEFGRSWWAQEFCFTEEQWQAILNTLRGANAKPEDRLSLEFIARRHGRARSKQCWHFNRSQTRKTLERIADLAAKLRSELTLDRLMDAEIAHASSVGKEGFGEMNGFWPYIGDIESLERRAREVARSLRGRSAKPANVDEVRNGTLELLTQYYERLMGKPARVSVYTYGDDAGKAYGRLVEFMKAFMAAIPAESRANSDEITGDKVKGFLARRKKNGERASQTL